MLIKSLKYKNELYEGFFKIGIRQGDDRGYFNNLLLKMIDLIQYLIILFFFLKIIYFFINIKDLNILIKNISKILNSIILFFKEESQI